MNLADVMTETENALKTINGLRVFGWSTPRIAPPAAIVTLPENVLFHQTYGTGSTKLEDLIVVVMVSRAKDRTAVKDLMPYVAETGAKSVKTVLEGWAPAGAAWDVLTVNSVEFDAVAYGEVPYLAAMFHMEIIGKGALP